MLLKYENATEPFVQAEELCQDDASDGKIQEFQSKPCAEGHTEYDEGYTAYI